MSDVEEWRPVVGFEHGYEVSSHGRVRSIPRYNTNSLGRVRFLRGKLFNLSSTTSAGHKSVQMGEGPGTRRTVHRLVAFAFLGNPEPGQEVCHNDGDPTNNHVSNLRWDTRSANHKDAVKHGTNWKTATTHCPRGHALEPFNVEVWKAGRGHRQCKACRRVSMWKALEHIPTDSPTFQQAADWYYVRLEDGSMIGKSRGVLITETKAFVESLNLA